MELGNIGKSPVCPSSVHDLSISQLTVNPGAFLTGGWMDFLHIGYLNQVPYAADTSKIPFGSVPNLSNNVICS